MLSRRRFLTGATALGALTWIPACRVPPVGVQSCVVPPAFPPSIPLVQEAFVNWSHEIALEPAWVCTPHTPADVVTIANWAWENGYRIRARGASHTWSPLVIAPASTCETQVVLVDTTRYLTAVAIAQGVVTAQTGFRMETLLTRLEEAGYGLTAVPAPGDVTLGGVLAIAAHGTAGPEAGAAHTFAGYIERTGRAEAIWFPFTENPWLKVWTRTPTKPLTARHVQHPFNYPFSDTLPPALSELASQVQAGAGPLTPLFGQTQYNVVAAGLVATLSHDTPYATQLYHEIETWLFTRYADAAVRPEWSKGWAYTDNAAWMNQPILTSNIPDAYRAGQHAGDDWDWAVATLDAHDPHRIFSNEFLDRLF